MTSSGSDSEKGLYREVSIIVEWSLYETLIEGMRLFLMISRQ